MKNTKNSQTIKQRASKQGTQARSSPPVHLPLLLLFSPVITLIMECRRSGGQVYMKILTSSPPPADTPIPPCNRLNRGVEEEQWRGVYEDSYLQTMSR